MRPETQKQDPGSVVFRSGFICRRKSSRHRHREEPKRGDVAISLCKGVIASPPARNDITANGVRDTYETASSLQSHVLTAFTSSSVTRRLPQKKGASVKPCFAAIARISSIFSWVIWPFPHEKFSYRSSSASTIASEKQP